MTLDGTSSSMTAKQKSSPTSKNSNPSAAATPPPDSLVQNVRLSASPPRRVGCAPAPTPSSAISRGNCVARCIKPSKWATSNPNSPSAPNSTLVVVNPKSIASTATPASTSSSPTHRPLRQRIPQRNTAHPTSPINRQRDRPTRRVQCPGGGNNGRPRTLAGKHNPPGTSLVQLLQQAASPPCSPDPAQAKQPHRTAGPRRHSPTTPTPPHSPDPSTTPAAPHTPPPQSNSPPGDFPDTGHTTPASAASRPSITKSPRRNLLPSRTPLFPTASSTDIRAQTSSPHHPAAPSAASPERSAPPPPPHSSHAAPHPTPSPPSSPTASPHPPAAPAPLPLKQYPAYPATPHSPAPSPHGAPSVPRCFPAPRSTLAIATPAATRLRNSLPHTPHPSPPTMPQHNSPPPPAKPQTRRRKAHNTSGTYKAPITHADGARKAIAAPGISLKCATIQTIQWAKNVGNAPQTPPLCPAPYQFEPPIAP